MRLGRIIINMCAVAGLAAVGAVADDAPPVPADAKPGVSLITINAHNMTPQETFDEIGKQAHVEFTTNGNFWNQRGMDHKIDVDLTNRPFWSAVNEICEKCNVSPQPGWGNNAANQIMLQQTSRGNGQVKPPTFEKDGIIVQALSFNRQQNVSYTQARQGANYCAVQMMVFVDPSLHVSSFNSNLKPDEVVDDAGNSMMPEGNNNAGYNGQKSGLIFSCQVPLKYPDNAGKKIAILKCTLAMLASDEVETMTIDKPLEADETTKTLGDYTVIFHSLKKNGNGYELKLGVSTDKTNRNENLFEVVRNGKLTDENGKSYANNGGGGGGSMQKAEYTYSYSFNGQGTQPGDPVKWVIEIPTKTHELKVPVEFTDLALP